MNKGRLKSMNRKQKTGTVQGTRHALPFALFIAATLLLSGCPQPDIADAGDGSIAIRSAADFAKIGASDD
jgi:hypothetical protein